MKLLLANSSAALSGGTVGIGSLRWWRLSLIISKDYYLFKTVTFFLDFPYKVEMILSEFSRKSRLGQRNVTSGVLQPSTEIGPMTT